MHPRARCIFYGLCSNRHSLLLNSYLYNRLFAPLALWRLSVSLRPLVQSLGFARLLGHAPILQKGSRNKSMVVSGQTLKAKRAVKVVGNRSCTGLLSCLNGTMFVLENLYLSPLVDVLLVIKPVYLRSRKIEAGCLADLVYHSLPC